MCIHVEDAMEVMAAAAEDVTKADATGMGTETADADATKRLRFRKP